MKILFSTLGYPTKEHPFAAFISAIAEEFAKRGHDVTVIAPQSITRSLIRRTITLPKFEEIQVEGAQIPIKVHRPKSLTFGEGKIRGYMTIWSNRICVERFLRRLKQNFDVAYAHFWEAAFNVLQYSKSNNIPLVVVTGEDRIILHKYLSEKTLLKLRDGIQKVIGVSTKNVKDSVEYGLCEYSKTTVIPNGADLRIFHPYDKSKLREEFNIEKDKFIVAFTGRFIYRKGAKRIEEAILSLRDESIGAIYLGAPMKDEDPEQEPNGPEILFKGIVNHNDLPKWLNIADVFVLPTLAEGCSNAIVEAMACGLPIISSDKDFNHDILDDRNSFLIDPLNIEQIASKIKELKDSPVIAEQMGQASLAKSVELSLENRATKIIQLLENLVNENNRI